MLHTKFQASEESGAEKISEYFLCISMVQTWDPWGRSILDPWTTI